MPPRPEKLLTRDEEPQVSTDSPESDPSLEAPLWIRPGLWWGTTRVRGPVDPLSSRHAVLSCRGGGWCCCHVLFFVTERPWSEEPRSSSRTAVPLLDWVLLPALWSSCRVGAAYGLRAVCVGVGVFFHHGI